MCHNVTSTNSTTSASSMKITTGEIINICGVNRPEVPSAVTAASVLDETLVQREVMSDAVSPAAVVVSVVGEVLLDELVDITKKKTFLFGCKDCHGNQSDVGMSRLTVLI